MEEERSMVDSKLLVVSLVGHFFEDYNERMTNSGCNQLPSRLWNDWSESQKDKLLASYNAWSERYNYCDEIATDIEDIQDFCLLDFLTNMLMENFLEHGEIK